MYLFSFSFHIFIEILFLFLLFSYSSNFFTQRKSSKELYREAAKMLGIACSLSDNCRCIECQVSEHLFLYVIQLVI